MAFVDQLHQPLAVDMGVDLRRRDIGMTEQGLERAQVRSPGQQVSGKCMPQNMGTDPLGRDPRLPRQPAHDLKQPHPADMPATARKQPRPVGKPGRPSLDRFGSA